MPKRQIVGGHHHGNGRYAALDDFFGNSAIWLIVQQGATDLAQTVMSNQTLALFNFPEHFPFSSLLSFIAMAMVAVFFVTFADSGARVVDTLASRATDKPPVGMACLRLYALTPVCNSKPPFGTSKPAIQPLPLLTFHPHYPSVRL